MRLKANNSEQKLKGAYYTPKELADAIVSFFVHEKEMRILEPSAGDGVFVDALVSQGLLESPSTLTAVEIDAFALEKIDKAHGNQKNIELINSDFFDFYSKFESTHYDLILGNPPYIRYQYLEPYQRELMSEILESQGMHSNKLINAWVGFVVACTNLLSDNGVMIFVLPAELLQVAYAENLRCFLASEFKELTLVTFDKLIFDGAEQEVVVFAGIKGKEEPKIRTIHLQDVQSLNTPKSKNVDYQPLDLIHEKWTRYFIDSADASILRKLSNDKRLVKLESLGRINVGITTGNNGYFSLNDSTTKEYELAPLTVPLLGRSSHSCGVYFTMSDWEFNRNAGKRARLLVLRDGQYEELSPVQRSYIDAGIKNGENKGYKCSIRDSWYVVPSVWVPDAFFLRRSNLYPKFILNDCGAVSTDTMHRIKFNDTVDPKLALLAYYNSISFAHTEFCGRSYGGGVLEILPKEVGNILIPDVNKLSIDPSIVDELVSFIDTAIRTGSDIEEVLDKVDQMLLIGVMGFKKSDCEACRRIWKGLQQRRLSRGSGGV